MRRYLTESPRAGRQQGQVGSSGCMGGLSLPVRRQPGDRSTSTASCPVRCRTRWLGCRGAAVPRALPPLPAGDLRRGDRAGPRDRAAAGRAGQQPGQPRLPLLRSAGLRQDHQRADPGARAQLREGADLRPVRGVPVLPRPRARRARLGRRHRDRRRQPRRCGRRPRPARAGLLRPGQQPVQGLHHRRGPHGQLAGLQRPAQAGRGAPGAPEVHLRHHRAGEGHPDHPLAHPPLPLPADPATHALGLPRRAVRQGGRHHRPRGAAARRARGGGVGP